MDIDLARTFLAIADRGSFVAAAQQLHLTQTAVSARVRALEQQLGRSLFVRNKAGARLTRAGERFARHAGLLVQGWEQARRDVALAPDQAGSIRIGAEAGIGMPMLAGWLAWMRRTCPGVAAGLEITGRAPLLDAVGTGLLDLAVLYSPEHRPGIVCEVLDEESLVMVGSVADAAMDPLAYVHVDWGPAFNANLRAAFPILGNAPVSVSHGPLALQYVLDNGGFGCFRASVVAPLLAAGRLHRIVAAPVFAHSSYAVHAPQNGNPFLECAREGLRLMATERAARSISSVAGRRSTADALLAPG